MRHICDVMILLVINAREHGKQQLIQTAEHAGKRRFKATGSCMEPFFIGRCGIRSGIGIVIVAADTPVNTQFFGICFTGNGIHIGIRVKQIRPIHTALRAVGILNGIRGKRSSGGGKLCALHQRAGGKRIGIYGKAKLICKLIDRFTVGNCFQSNINTQDRGKDLIIKTVPKILQHGGDLREDQIYKGIDNIIGKQFFTQQFHHILAQRKAGEHGAVFIQLDQVGKDGNHILTSEEGIELGNQIVYHFIGNGVGIVGYGVVAAAEVAGVGQTDHKRLGLREFVSGSSVAIIRVIVMLLRPVGKTALIHEGLYFGKQTALFQLIISSFQRPRGAGVGGDAHALRKVQLGILERRAIGGCAGIEARRAFVHIHGGVVVVRVLQVIEHMHAGLHLVLIVGGVGQRGIELQRALQHRFDDGEIAQRDLKIAVAVVGGVHRVRDTVCKDHVELRVQTVDIRLQILVEGADELQEIGAGQRVLIEIVRLGGVGGVVIFTIYIYIAVRIAFGIAEVFRGDGGVAVVLVHQLVALGVHKGIVIYLLIHLLIFLNIALQLVHRKRTEVHVDALGKVGDEGLQLKDETAARRFIIQVIAHRFHVCGIGILVKVGVAEDVELQLAGIGIVRRERGYVAVEQTEQNFDLRVGNVVFTIGVIIAELIAARGNVHTILGGNLILINITVDQGFQRNQIVILIVILQQRQKILHVRMIVTVHCIELLEALAGGVVRYVAIHSTVDFFNIIKPAADTRPDGLRLQLGHIVKIERIFDLIGGGISIERKPVAVQRVRAGGERILADVLRIGLTLIIVQGVNTGGHINWNSTRKRLIVAFTGNGGILPAEIVHEQKIVVIVGRPTAAGGPEGVILGVVVIHTRLRR